MSLHDLVDKTAIQFDSALYPYKDFSRLLNEPLDVVRENVFCQWIRRRKLSPEQRKEKYRLDTEADKPRQRRKEKEKIQRSKRRSERKKKIKENITKNIISFL